jgi:hypothetical protein
MPAETFVCSAVMRLDDSTKRCVLITSFNVVQHTSFVKRGGQTIAQVPRSVGRSAMAQAGMSPQGPVVACPACRSTSMA